MFVAEVSVTIPKLLILRHLVLQSLATYDVVRTIPKLANVRHHILQIIATRTQERYLILQSSDMTNHDNATCAFSAIAMCKNGIRFTRHDRSVYPDSWCQERYPSYRRRDMTYHYSLTSVLKPKVAASELEDSSAASASHNLVPEFSIFGIR